MSESAHVTRRSFLGGVLAGACLARIAPAVAHPRQAAENASDDVGLPASYLETGVAAFANAWRTNNAIAGHHGAAVIAGYFFSRENPLDEPARKALRAEIDAFLRDLGPSFRFESPAEAPDPDLCTRIVTTLETRIDEFRTGGHNVIWATLPLKALRHAPSLARPTTIDGICRLIELFHTQLPARHDTDYNRSHPIAKFQTPAELVTSAFSSFAAPVSLRPSEQIHFVTHADALAELWEMGFESLAIRGSEAMKINVNRIALSTPARRPPDETLPASPLAHGYWSDSRVRSGGLGAGHHLKFPYSYYRRRKQLSDVPLRQRCDDQVLQMLAAAMA